jgi:hypothetical protein
MGAKSMLDDAAAHSINARNAGFCIDSKCLPTERAGDLRRELGQRHRDLLSCSLISFLPGDSPLGEAL